MNIECLEANQFPLAAKFYKETRYGGKPGREETVLVTRNPSGALIACVRLQPREEGYFLRALVVAPEERGKGTGQAFLDGVCRALGEQPIWCFPYRWLEPFYARSGFKLVDTLASPTWYREAYNRLIANREVVPMALNAMDDSIIK